MRPIVLFLLAVLAIGGLPARAASAASTSITINATIVEVQCTAAQKARIRACAKGQELFSTEAAKLLTKSAPATGAAPLVEQRYEVRRDTDRQVVIRTILY
ncbi:MAG: hypothetical protein U1F10_05200 [Burkholderiales bacterium]